MRYAMRAARGYFNGKEIVGAEVGVFRGKSAADTMYGMNNLKMLYLIDPYEMYEGYDNSPGNLVGAQAYAQRQFDNKGFTNYTWMIKYFSAEIVPEPLDFIYIDGNHNYEDVLFDIQEAKKIVKIDGVISGHDYYPIGHPREHDFGVGKAVRESFSDDIIHADRKDWWVFRKDE